MSAAQTPPPRCLQQSPDLVTQAQEQLALLSSFYYNYTGGVAVTAPPVSVTGEPVAAAPGAQEHDMQQLARNIVAAHKRLDELVRALPASEPLHEQLARIAALRSDLAATGAELEAELERAAAAQQLLRQQFAAASDLALSTGRAGR